jgi:hypothetical protein
MPQFVHLYQPGKSEKAEKRKQKSGDVWDEMMMPVGDDVSAAAAAAAG